VTEVRIAPTRQKKKKLDHTPTEKPIVRHCNTQDITQEEVEDYPA
jgi:hypothetical protein